ncbi:hypothetical protein MASR2M18_15250 [Ignavibacteria bacterium]|nr:choice-of-anchor D domain-containing protein [Bacteroidota bacterium]
MPNFTRILSVAVIAFTALFSDAVFAQRWEQAILPSQFAGNYWLDVYFLPSNPQLGWICGREGKILRTFDGGDSWFGTVIPGIDTLESVHFPTPLVGFVSGPGGIFRSNDGGASWRSIKPDSARELWGCYFANADTGVVLGGGCSDRQYFFRTTDGGASWNHTTANVSSSGLTDAVLLSAAGRGYATSSGYLWATNNGGKTWDILSPTGEKYWQEELCVSRNSFLLPFAGTTCGGVGTGGGMRFGRNGGYTWSEFQTGAFMFGSFLLNDSSGWAVGVKQNIWYTNNYGVSWELRNCGVGTVDFDDIWMINENAGWAVGSAVYRLVAPYRSITRTSLDFSETCYPGSRYDTLFVKSTSFSETSGALSVVGMNQSDFSIIEPATATLTVRPCDSVRIVVKFTPAATVDAIAVLRIAMFAPYAAEFNLPLSGKGKRALSQSADTLLDMGLRPCGRFSFDSIRFINPSPDPESVTWIDYLESSDEVRPVSSVPLTIPGAGEASAVFRTYFADTGTVVNIYRFWIGPCARILKVKATGYSPVITLPFARTIGLNCKPERFDTMMIANTGNAPLKFSDIWLSGPDRADFSIVGWADGAALLREIAPKHSAGIIVKFAPSKAGAKKMQLLLKNNDSTTARGDRSTVIVQYQGGQAGAAVKLITSDSLNGGILCPGGQSSQRIVIRNIGGSPSRLAQISNLKPGLRSSVISGQLPLEFKNDDSLVITIFFAPQFAGILADTLNMRFEPCGEIIRVAVRCDGITTQLAAVPDTVFGTVKAVNKTRKFVTVRSAGTDAAIISSISLMPSRADWRLADLPKLPFTLPAGEELSVAIEFEPARDTVFEGKICFMAEELCDASACVQIKVNAIDAKLDVSLPNIDFPDNICGNPVRTQQIVVVNNGSLPDTLIEATIISGTADFAVTSPVIPLILKKGDSAVIIVECRQQREGIITGELAIRSAKMQAAALTVPLRAKFAQAQLTVNAYGVFFGEVEHCDSARSIRIRISNIGTMQETVQITRLNAVPVFGVSPSDEAIILPGGYIDLDVLCEPSKASIVGLFAENIRLSGLVCGQNFDIQVAANIINPTLTVKPDSVSFGTLITGDESIQTVLIFNNSEKAVTIENILFESGYREFAIIGMPALPRILQSNETDSVTIRFYAKRSGISTDRLLVYGGSLCSSLTEIDLTAEVDDVIYPAYVSIGRYEVRPGDSISAKLELQGSILDAAIRSIAARITYDSNLFFLTSISYDSAGHSIRIPYSEDSAGVSFTINAKPGAPLGREGVVASLHGIALFALPDTCALGIAAFSPQSRRRVDITRTDGFLQSRSVCGPLVGFVPRPIASALLLNTAGGSGCNLQIRLRANVPAEATITLKNIFGITAFYSAGVNVGIEESDCLINTSTLPAGTYFLEITASGITERHKILIFR